MMKMAVPPGLAPAPDEGREDRHQRIRDQIEQAIGDFASAMLKKMCSPKNLAKSDRDLWHILPLDALVKKLEIELAEFKVAHEYEGPEEAQGELVDVANFAMMTWVRLRILRENKESPSVSVEDAS